MYKTFNKAAVASIEKGRGTDEEQRAMGCVLETLFLPEGLHKQIREQFDKDETPEFDAMFYHGYHEMDWLTSYFDGKVLAACEESAQRQYVKRQEKLKYLPLKEDIVNMLETTRRKSKWKNPYEIQDGKMAELFKMLAKQTAKQVRWRQVNLVGVLWYAEGQHLDTERGRLDFMESLQEEMLLVTHQKTGAVIGGLQVVQVTGEGEKKEATLLRIK